MAEQRVPGQKKPLYLLSRWVISIWEGKCFAETKKRGRTEAAIALRSTIDTIVGKSEQTEIYIRVLEDGKWLIDKIVIRDEVEIEELEKSPREWEIEM